MRRAFGEYDFDSHWKWGSGSQLLVGGGYAQYILGWKKYARDIDLFTISPRSKFLVHIKPADIKFVTKNAITLVNNVQLITTKHENPELLADSFDFTMSKVICNLNGYLLYKHPEARTQYFKKILEYTGSDNPLGSLKRIHKYTNQGFRLKESSIELLYEDLAKCIKSRNDPEGFTPETTQLIRGMYDKLNVKVLLGGKEIPLDLYKEFLNAN